MRNVSMDDARQSVPITGGTDKYDRASGPVTLTCYCYQWPLTPLEPLWVAGKGR